jgi:hypothetical protein
MMKEKPVCQDVRNKLTMNFKSLKTNNMKSLSNFAKSAISKSEMKQVNGGATLRCIRFVERNGECITETYLFRGDRCPDQA